MEHLEDEPHIEPDESSSGPATPVQLMPPNSPNQTNTTIVRPHMYRMTHEAPVEPQESVVLSRRHIGQRKRREREKGERTNERLKTQWTTQLFMSNLPNNDATFNFDCVHVVPAHGEGNVNVVAATSTDNILSKRQIGQRTRRLREKNDKELVIQDFKLSNREISQRMRRMREKSTMGITMDRENSEILPDSNLNKKRHVDQDRVNVPSIYEEGGPSIIGRKNKGKEKMNDIRTSLDNTPSNQEMAQRMCRARERQGMGVVIRDNVINVDTNVTMTMPGNKNIRITASAKGKEKVVNTYHEKTLSNRATRQCQTSFSERDEMDSINEFNGFMTRNDTIMHNGIPCNNQLSRRSIGQRKRRSREKDERRASFTTNRAATHVINMESRSFTDGVAMTCGPTQNTNDQASDEEFGTANLSCDAFIEDECVEGEDLEVSEQRSETRVAVECHYLGAMNIPCKHCFALHWEAELLSNGNLSNPLFGLCCLQGKIKLEPLAPLPPPLKALYEGTDERSISFRKYIREYNAANAFTSLGAKMDDRVINGHGPTSFTIHGELRHQTGALLPDPGRNAIYAQLYIYDPTTALEQRCQNNERLSKDVMQIIQDTLWQSNPFRQLYQSAFEVLKEKAIVGGVEDFSAYLHYREGTDRRRYNLPSAEEIAVIMPGEAGELTASRDIILRLKGGHALTRIHECHPAYLPLHYVLFFPYGELGWSDDMKQFDVVRNRRTNARLTHREYMAYRLFERLNEYPTILRGGKLFQEFSVDAFAAEDQNRLHWVRLNQRKIRAELYKSLTDIADDGLSGNDVGRKYILPTTHTGSSRYMYAVFQDSLAITRYNKHPDIFLTMTANPNWPEILEALGPNQNASLRPDVVARVFRLKKKALLDEIYENGIFGRVVAHVYTIEFQKRGLPHMHVLIFLHPTDKIRTIAQVDQHISAEFPDPTANPRLFQIIKKCMVHGPCGVRNPNAPCMDNGKCTKHYPRKFTTETTMDGDGYPIYRRRDIGKSWMTSRGHCVDNRDVVPYNPYLSERFNCHINVEVCASVRAVKYIHKYIYKGHDRTTMILQRDEIKQYIDARYIGPVEAIWRLLRFPLHQEVPSVKRLALHLPGEHLVTFEEGEQIRNVVGRAAEQKTTLTAFFDYCANNVGAREYKYQEFPEHFVIDPHTKLWQPRQIGFQIGRIYAASPNEGERFYLRLLLTTVKGPRSYECLRTVDDVCHPTFKATCATLGLLENDSEWIQCLTEATTTHTGHRLRRLFSVILLHCAPLEPALLWQMFSTNMCDDLRPRLCRMYNIQAPSSDEVTDYGLYLLDELLQQSGKSNV